MTFSSILNFIQALKASETIRAAICFGISESMDTWGEYTREYQRHSAAPVDLPASKVPVTF
jgi:hypothetical protein